MIVQNNVGVDQAPQTRGPREAPMRPSNNFQMSNLILIKTKKRFFCNLSCTISLLINKYLLNVKNIIVSKTLKAFLLLFCGPPTQDMGLMRPAISKIGHMRPPSQFEFETPGLKVRLGEVKWGLALNFTKALELWWAVNTVKKWRLSVGMMLISCQSNF